MTTDPTTAAARLVGGQIDAMKTAAGNTAGAMTGFMGMGMAAGAMGGMNAQNLFAMGQQAVRTARAPAGSRPAPPRRQLEVQLRRYRYRQVLPGMRQQKAGAEARCGQLDLQLRCYRYRQVLPGVRQAPPGGSRRLDLQLRRGEQRQVLLRVRQTQARRYAQI